MTAEPSARGDQQNTKTQRGGDRPRVTSEVGRLRTVVLHRPGMELRRLTPRNNDRLLFDGIPWVARAQEEHDRFAEALRGRGVEVLYLADLLAEALEVPEARAETIAVVVSSPYLGQSLCGRVKAYLEDLTPSELADVLMGGLRLDELAEARPSREPGLVTALSVPEDFVVEPLPNLLFTRDSSAWIGDKVAVTSLAMPARARETSLTRAVYTYHPRFAGTEHVYEPSLEHIEGGDLLVLSDGVLAVGTGERTTPAGVERLARRVFDGGVAQTVLAVPIAQERATMHLDTVCTMVDADAIVMYPNIADSLQAYTVTAVNGDLHVAGPEPFLRSAAKAMGIDRLRVIDTGLDPVTAEREQWDDGNNTLAIAPGVVVAYERNVETNDRLEADGIEVVRLSGSELGSGRGGPRCMSCPVVRDPLPPSS
ncbi:MAG: arginine deiminase [Actinomycetes bacterium]